MIDHKKDTKALPSSGRKLLPGTTPSWYKTKRNCCPTALCCMPWMRRRNAKLFAEAMANKAKGLINCILCHVPSSLRTSRSSNNTPYKVSIFPAAYNLTRTRLRSVEAHASVPATISCTKVLIGCLVANATSMATSLSRLFIGNASPGNLGDASPKKIQEND